MTHHLFDKGPTKQGERLCRLSCALILLAVSGCGTQEVEPNHMVLAGTEPGPLTGILAVVFPPLDGTYEAEQARVAMNSTQPQYQVWMDGQLMVSRSGDGSLSPLTVTEGAVSSMGYFKAGMHHFTIAEAGSPAIFDADNELAGGTTTLFLYGTLDSLQGRFVDSPNAQTPGMEQIMLVNLISNGQSLELVKCTSATDCTSFGDGPRQGPGDYMVFDTPAFGFTDDSSSLGPDGAGYGYRMVPSTTVPNPPVLPLHAAFGTPGVANFLVAPVYMSPGGEPELEL